MLGGTRRTRSRTIACIALLLTAACGDDGGGGTAGGPAPPGMLGEPCSPSCQTGLACTNGGAFAGLCTVGCTTQQSCLLLAPSARAVCVGQVNAQCALACDTSVDCPSGTQCAPVASSMVCIVGP